jgi:hypothetical protein
MAPVRKAMHLLKRIKLLVLAALIALSPSSAMAGYTYSGLVTGTQTVDTGSMHFRVFLNTTMTNCDLNFAFVETSSTLFTSYVSGLTTAYSLGKPVTLQVNREASGYCRIYFLSY